MPDRPTDQSAAMSADINELADEAKSHLEALWRGRRAGRVGHMLDLVAAVDALRAAALGVVPAGWRQVPERPTPAMAIAGIEATRRNRSAINGVPQYLAMLAAAPPAPSANEAGPEVAQPTWGEGTDRQTLLNKLQDGEPLTTDQRSALWSLLAAAPPVDEAAEVQDYETWFKSEQGKPYDGMWQFGRAAWHAAIAAAKAVPQAVWKAALTEDEIGTLESAVENMRSADRDERTIDARFTLASKLASIAADCARGGRASHAGAAAWQTERDALLREREELLHRANEAAKWRGIAEARGRAEAVPPSLLADIREYRQRVETHVPFELAAWARERGDAIVAALSQGGGAAVQQEPDALAEMEARKDAAYLERNQVVAALAKCFPSGVARTAIEGWSEDWHGCVYIDLPTGQASWHFHDSQAYLFAGLPPYTKPWDGHDTPTKYERLAALAVREEPVAPGTRTLYDELGEERIDRIADIVIRGMEGGLRGFMKTWGWHTFARELLRAVQAGAVRERREPLTDSQIDSICAPGRPARWHGDGRQYDRDTARLIERAYGIGGSEETKA